MSYSGYPAIGVPEKRDCWTSKTGGAWKPTQTTLAVTREEEGETTPPEITQHLTKGPLPVPDTNNSTGTEETATTVLLSMGNVTFADDADEITPGKEKGNLPAKVWIGLACGLTLLAILVLALVVRRYQNQNNDQKNTTKRLSDIQPLASSGEEQDGNLHGIENAPNNSGGMATGSSPGKSNCSPTMAPVYNVIAEDGNNSQPTADTDHSEDGEGGVGEAALGGRAYCTIADGAHAMSSENSSVRNLKSARSNQGADSDSQIPQVKDRPATGKREKNTTVDQDYSKLNNGKLRSAADIPKNMLQTYNGASASPATFVVAGVKKGNGSGHVYSSLTSRDKMSANTQLNVPETYNKPSGVFNTSSVNPGTTGNPGSDSGESVAQSSEVNVNGISQRISRNDNGVYSSATERSVYCTITDAEVTSANNLTRSSAEPHEGDRPKVTTDAVSRNPRSQARAKTDKPEISTSDHHYSKLDNGKLRSAADIPNNMLQTYNSASASPVKFVVDRERKAKDSGHIYSSLSSRDKMPSNIKESVPETYNQPAGEFNPASFDQDTTGKPSEPNTEYFTLEDDEQGHTESGACVQPSSSMGAPPSQQELTEYFELEDDRAPDDKDSDPTSSTRPAPITPCGTEYFDLEADTEPADGDHQNHGGVIDSYTRYSKHGHNNFHIYKEIPNGWEKPEYAELD